MLTVVERQQVFLPTMFPGALIVNGFEFRDCIIQGPLAIAVLNDVEIIGCSGGTPTALANMFVTLDAEAVIDWAIGLQNVRLLRCELRRIGLVGNAEMVAHLKRGFDFISGEPLVWPRT